MECSPFQLKANKKSQQLSTRQNSTHSICIKPKENTLNSTETNKISNNNKWTPIIHNRINFTRKISLCIPTTWWELRLSNQISVPKIKETVNTTISKHPKTLNNSKWILNSIAKTKWIWTVKDKPSKLFQLQPRALTFHQKHLFQTAIRPQVKPSITLLLITSIRNKRMIISFMTSFSFLLLIAWRTRTQPRNKAMRWLV